MKFNYLHIAYYFVYVFFGLEITVVHKFCVGMQAIIKTLLITDGQRQPHLDLIFHNSSQYNIVLRELLIVQVSLFCKTSFTSLLSEVDVFLYQ